MTLVLRAKQFATAAHASINHVRKYTGEPYIVHPAEVVAILIKMSRFPPSDEQIAAAWLHDTVEDTPVTLQQIREQFGPKVEQLVEELTDVSKPEHGNRTVRKTMDRAHTAIASPAGQSVKLADLISNTASITQHAPDFARVYMEEKRELLKVLKQGDPGLHSLASYIVGRYYASLEAVAA